MPDTRQIILDTTADLIADEGVRGVSFREVARRAGVSHQTPYHHFGNLQGILRSVAQAGFAELTKAMRDAADAAGDGPLERLTAAGQAYVRFSRSNTGHFRVMFEAPLVDVHDADEPMAEAEGTHRTLAELAQTAWAAGHGQWMDAEVMTHLCWSTVHGLAVLRLEGHLQGKQPRTSAELDKHQQDVIRALSGLLGGR